MLKNYLEYNDDSKDVDEKDNSMKEEKWPEEGSPEDYGKVEVEGTVQDSQEDT